MFSDIQVFPVHDNPTIKARGSFKLHNAFRVNCTVIANKKGELFVGLPGRYGEDRKTGNKKWYSDVYCDDDKVKAELQKRVLEAYNQKSNGNEDQGEASGPTDQTGPNLGF